MNLNTIKIALETITTELGKADKVYETLLTQDGGEVPPSEGEFTENTIGEIVWTWSDTGTYEANSAGLFKEGKTFFYCGSTQGSFFPIVEWISENKIRLSLSNNLDGFLLNFPFKIVVKN